MKCTEGCNGGVMREFLTAEASPRADRTLTKMVEAHGTVVEDIEDEDDRNVPEMRSYLLSSEIPEK